MISKRNHEQFDVRNNVVNVNSQLLYCIASFIKHLLLNHSVQTRNRNEPAGIRTNLQEVHNRAGSSATANEWVMSYMTSSYVAEMSNINHVCHRSN